MDCGIRQPRNSATRRATSLIEVIVVISIFAVLTGLLMAAVGHARMAALRTQCQNNLRQLALAVLTYESSSGFLPPAAVQGPAPTLGIPERGAHGMFPFILAQLGEDGRALHYRWDVPFDDEANARAVQGAIASLQCPFAESELTIEVAGGSATHYGPLDVNSMIMDVGDLSPDVRTEGALLTNARSRLADIADGASTTILLSESAGGSPWASPSTPVPARMVITGAPGPHRTGVNVGMADGSVRPLKVGASSSILARLATRAGGEPIPEADY